MYRLLHCRDESLSTQRNPKPKSDGVGFVWVVWCGVSGCASGLRRVSLGFSVIGRVLEDVVSGFRSGS